MRIRRLLSAAVLPLTFAPCAEAQAVFECSITYDAGMAGINLQITQLAKGSMIQCILFQIVFLVDLPFFSLAPDLGCPPKYTGVLAKQRCPIDFLLENKHEYFD